ncbi:hypothetical protein GCK72_007812 [Caenorhabditis remanei]|uniref:Uncharacterized protein n=1 Tax=Caenorhabditis remanei TaxID=31234 RepID=A0A6A5HNB6_CAERE|nr:hypothetical protein GCK72_007812 [Caenorhabditis remanei]KAF1767853.1 hypothetical protein GCK72_007812 [Caenorhabditis remanei]
MNSAKLMEWLKEHSPFLPRALAGLVTLVILFAALVLLRYRKHKLVENLMPGVMVRGLVLAHLVGLMAPEYQLEQDRITVTVDNSKAVFLPDGSMKWIKISYQMFLLENASAILMKMLWRFNLLSTSRIRVIMVVIHILLCAVNFLFIAADIVPMILLALVETSLFLTCIPFYRISAKLQANRTLIKSDTQYIKYRCYGKLGEVVISSFFYLPLLAVYFGKPSTTIIWNYYLTYSSQATVILMVGWLGVLAYKEASRPIYNGRPIGENRESRF